MDTTTIEWLSGGNVAHAVNTGVIVREQRGNVIDDWVDALCGAAGGFVYMRDMAQAFDTPVFALYANRKCARCERKVGQ